MGWGAFNASEEGSDVLKWVSQDPVSRSACGTFYQQTISSTLICAGDQANSGTCECGRPARRCRTRTRAALSLPRPPSHQRPAALQAAIHVVPCSPGPLALGSPVPLSPCPSVPLSLCPPVPAPGLAAGLGPGPSSPRLVCRSPPARTAPTPACAPAGVGDSGGPLLIPGRGPGYDTLVGLTSFGSMPCGMGAPTAYTNVAMFRPWIQAQLAAWKLSDTLRGSG